MNKVDKETGEIIEETSTLTVTEEHGGVTAIFDTSKANFASSIQGVSYADKIAILKALSEPTYKIGDLASPCLCYTADVIGHAVKINDSSTLKKIDAVRCVLVLSNGDTVASVSEGFRSALTMVMGLFGKPTWKTDEMPNGLPLVIKKVKAGKGYTYNIDVALDPKRFKGQIIGQISK